MTFVCPHEANFFLKMHLVSCNTSTRLKNNKPRSVMDSDQQDNTLNKQRIAMLQLSSTVALGRVVLAFSVF